MASDDLDIPQIAVVGVPEDNNHPIPTHILPPQSSDASRLPLGHATLPADNQGFLSLPTPILRSARNSLDAFGSATSDTSSLQPPPSPTLSARSSGSIRFATSTALRDNNPDEHDALSSLNLLAPPSRRHHRKGSVGTVSSVGSSSTERDIEDNQSFRLSPVRSAQSDAPSTLPSPTYTHVDPGPDVISRPSSAASFFRKTLHRVRRGSPSPSGETDTGSDTTRSETQKGDSADVKRKGPEIARPPLLDLKQEADLDVHPFAFKPLQLASLVDPKSLEALEGMGGVDALLRGLGTRPTHGISTKVGPPSHDGSGAASQDFRETQRSS
jgi:Ca2+-transporting ATPase